MIKVGDWIKNNDIRYPRGPFQIIEIEVLHTGDYAIIKGPYRTQKIRTDRIFEAKGVERTYGYSKVKA